MFVGSRRCAGTGLRQCIANLRFVVVAVYQGVDTVVIVYRNQDGGLVSEVLRFSGDVVVEGHGTYIVAGQ